MTRKVSAPRSIRPAPSVWERQRTGTRSAGIGPRLGFAAAIAAGFAAWAIAAAALPPDAVMPIVASLFLTLAAVVAIAACLRGWMDPPGVALPEVTWRDVAGALTLIGICAAATIDSDQMIRLMQTNHDAE